MRSSSAERAAARSCWTSCPTPSRAANAINDTGSRAVSRRPAKIWLRPPRRAGSTVGPASTIGPTRSGLRTASSVTIWQPIELATNAGRSSSSASSQAHRASVYSAMPGALRGRPLRPWPGRSGTNAANPSASSRASGTRYRPETP
ncbi:MAG TPA: hypothetical protein VLV46_02090 [Gaiellaceae bacterium]|nr:hypothetical protein [Gaiellaceae bacterium]